MKRFALPLLAVLVLSGCAADPEVIRVETTVTATATVTATPTPSASITPSAVREVPIPAPPAAASMSDDEFLASLAEIDPGLAHERSLGRAENVCLDIEQGKENLTVIANMEARFEGGTVPNLDGGQLAMLLNAIRQTCD